MTIDTEDETLADFVERVERASARVPLGPRSVMREDAVLALAAEGIEPWQVDPDQLVGVLLQE